MRIPEQEIENLLEVLCVKLGFCLPSNVSDRLIKFPPKTSDKFAKSVVEAEGLNTELMDKSVYNQVLKEVEARFEKYQ